MIKYRIGCLSWLKEDDPSFGTLDEAEDQAKIENLDESAWGIWEVDEDTNNADLIAIVYEQEFFYK